MSVTAAEVGIGMPREASRLLSFVRLVLIGGALSYRALFNWIKPSSYIPTMLGGTLFVLVFFTYLGRETGFEQDEFFVVGNAVFISSISCVYGAIMAIANERMFGTLSHVLASPASRTALFMGRAIPYVGNGLLVSGFGFVAGWFLFGVELGSRAIPALGVAVAVSAASCSGLGLALGSVGLRARDVFVIGNVAYYLLLLLCGANIPRESLPALLEAISSAVPLSHGIDAARSIADGATLGDVRGDLVTEAIVGAGYFAAAYVLLRLFESEGRRRASLERM